MRMKREIILKQLFVSWVVSVATLALSTPGPLAADELLAPLAGDLVPIRLVAPALVEAAATSERSPVSFSWAVDPRETVELATPPQRSESREYWVALTGAELARGAELFTAAPGALVRLQPADGKSDPAAIGLDRLTLISPDGRERSVAQAADALASAEQLSAAEAPFVEGTVAFRLREELGAGRFVLRGDAAAAGRYVLHVFDRGSDAALVLESERASYLAGERVQLSAQLVARSLRIQASAVDGFVVSPSGRQLPVTWKPLPGGGFTAAVQLPTSAESGDRGLWELVASARGERDRQVVLRSGRVAFAVATPTARLVGQATQAPAAKGEIAVRFDVEAAAAGRYELRGVVYGNDANGNPRPAAVAHSAAWLETGKAALTLRFDNAALRSSGLSGPWEVRALELRDQGRLGLLERRARALILP